MVATDEDALRGFRLITQLEGIIPGKFYFFGVVWFLYCGFVDLWLLMFLFLISHRTNSSSGIFTCCLGRFTVG